MSVRAKLLLAIAPLVLAIVAIGGMTVVTASRLGANPEAMLRQNYQSVLAAQSMREVSERIDAAASLALAGRGEALRGEVSYRERFADALRLQEASVFERAEGPPTELLRAEWAEYSQWFGRFAAAAGPAPGQAARLYADELRPRFERLRSILDEILSVNQRAMLDKSSWARDTADDATRRVVVGALVALAIAVPLSLLLVEHVISRLARVARAAERLGAGEFAARAGVEGRDEIAVLGQRFDAMAVSLEEYRASSLGRLQEAQRTSQAAIDSVPDPVVVFDAGGRLVRVNRSARELFALTGDPSDEWLPRLPGGVRGAVARARDHVLREGRAYLPHGFDEAVRVTTANGDAYLLARGTPVDRPETGTSGATVILQEVTRLRQLDVLRSSMVETVAHELRTPLTSLRMSILLCLEEAAAGPLPDGRARLLATARDDCERLQVIVDELLDLARIQSGEVELRRRPVPASELLDAAVVAAGSAARDRAVALRMEDGARDVTVDADADRLQLVFSNLLANAIRHSPEGGTVTVRAATAGDVVEFSVTDAGPGIAAEHLGLLFDRFYQVPGGPPGGVGLGLAIARELVVAHGGRIGVESRVGAGARFRFTVPRASGRAQVS